MKMQDVVETRGAVALPVVTFSTDHPIDRLVRPFLKRIAPGGALCAYPFARRANPADVLALDVQLWLDSGGFGSLRADAQVRKNGQTFDLETGDVGARETVSCLELLDFAERYASHVFALDFALPSGLADDERELRVEANVQNVRWTLANRRKRSLKIYGCAHGRTPEEYGQSAVALEALGVDGIGIGGLVPLASRPAEIESICRAVRAVVSVPLHGFGIGSPRLLRTLFADGVLQSADSSSYARHAASMPDAAITERLADAIDGLIEFTGAASPRRRAIALGSIA